MKTSTWLTLLTLHKLEKIMTQLSELESKLTIVSEKLDAIGEDTTSLLNAIEELKQQLTNVALPPGAEAKLAEVLDKAQALDDRVNAPTPEPTV